MSLDNSSFDFRLKQLLGEEYKKPERWLYLSFAENGFRGAIIILAHGMMDAITQMNLRDINPGGQVLAMDMSNDMMTQVPEEYRNRLLTKEEILIIFPSSRSIKDFEKDVVN